VVVEDAEEFVQSKGGGKRRNIVCLASKDRAMKRMDSSCDRKEIGDNVQLLVRQRLRESFRKMGPRGQEGRTENRTTLCKQIERMSSGLDDVHDCTTGVCMKHLFLMTPPP
jgi:hypothetical protein